MRARETKREKGRKYGGKRGLRRKRVRPDYID